MRRFVFFVPSTSTGPECESAHPEVQHARRPAAGPPIRRYWRIRKIADKAPELPPSLLHCERHRQLRCQRQVRRIAAGGVKSPQCAQAPIRSKWGLVLFGHSLHFPSGLFVFPGFRGGFYFPLLPCGLFYFPARSKIGPSKQQNTRRKNAPRRRQRRKMVVYQNEKTTTNAREADGALCRPRRTRPRPGRIAELVVNMYYLYKNTISKWSRFARVTRFA